MARAPWTFNDWCYRLAAVLARCPTKPKKAFRWLLARRQNGHEPPGKFFGMIRRCVITPALSPIMVEMLLELSKLHQQQVAADPDEVTAAEAP